MGALGYALRKFDFETAPIVLGVVLAPMLEMSFRQSLAMSSGSYAIFFHRPIATWMLAAGMALLLLSLAPIIVRGRKMMDWREALGLSSNVGKGDNP